MEKKKVVLAFSGGLDTSFCVKYLSEDCGYEVYTAIANTGGFSAAQLKKNEENASRSVHLLSGQRLMLRSTSHTNTTTRVSNT